MAASAPDSEPEALARLLDVEARRMRASNIGRSLLLAATALGLLLAGRQLALASGADPKLVADLCWMVAGALALAAGRGMWRQVRPLSRAEAAASIDRQHVLNDAVASAEAFQRRRSIGDLASAHVARTARMLGQMAGLHRQQRFDWTVAGAAATWILVGALSLLAPPVDRRAVTDPPVAGADRPASTSATPTQRASRATAETEAADPFGSAAAGAAGQDVSGAAVADQPVHRDPVAGELIDVTAPGGDAAGPHGGLRMQAARDDLARALSALFADQPGSASSGSGSGGVGLPKGGGSRRVESPRGDSEAGRLHLAVGTDQATEEASMPLERGSRSGDGTASPESAGWQPLQLAAPERGSAVPAGLGGVGNQAAESSRESQGVVAGELRLGPDAPVSPGARPLLRLPAFQAAGGHEDEDQGLPVPTRYQGARVAATDQPPVGPAGSEGVRDVQTAERRYRAAAREYGLRLNQAGGP